MQEQSPFKGISGWRRIVNALGYSISGLAAAYRHESAFRQEVWLALCLLITALLLPVGVLERCLMIASVLLVLIVELLNSAVEAVVDRVSFERHELAKRAKDMGSSSVLISLLLCLWVWALILLHRFAEPAWN